MYSWSADTSDWYGSTPYDYKGEGSEARARAAAEAAAAGPRAYGHKRAPVLSMIDPHKRLATESAHPIVVAVDVTGSMANWPFEIFDRLPLLYNTLSQYKEDVEICFAAIGDANCDRWPLQVTDFAHGYDLEQQLNALYGEGGGGDAPESYGLFAWWLENHVSTPRADRPFLIVFGDAPMHEKIPRQQIADLMGDRPEGQGLLDRMFGNSPNGSLDALETWRRVAAKWNTWFLRRPTGRKGDEVDRQWGTALGADHVFHIDDEQRAVDYAMGLIARSWGRFEDFQTNLRARQDETKVKSVAEKLRKEGPRVLQCPSCGARIPAEAAGRYVCTFCNSTLEL